MLAIKWLCLLLVLVAVPMTAQQSNNDFIPASTGLNLGHSNQRWNVFTQNHYCPAKCRRESIG